MGTAGSFKNRQTQLCRGYLLVMEIVTLIDVVRILYNQQLAILIEQLFANQPIIVYC